MGYGIGFFIKSETKFLKNYETCPGTGLVSNFMSVDCMGFLFRYFHYGAER